MRALHLVPLLVLSLAACDGGSKSSDSPGSGGAGDTPAYVRVDHILVGVSNPRLAVRRTEAEARALAYDLLAKVRAGGDWAALKREHSDDGTKGAPGGPYRMANFGARPTAPVPTEFPRQDMAPSFGDVSFALGVGEIGIADYHPQRSPFGFHVIKRIE